MYNNLEIREDNGVYKIGGYVNVTERNSKVIKDKQGKLFIERIKSGVFNEALESAESENRKIPLMFRHKELITNNVELREDSIGLRFEAEVDEVTYNMVKTERLQCSFGFRTLKQSIKDITFNFYERILEKIELLEVTITPNPAYNGSLVECREERENMKLEELLKLKEELDKQIAELTPEIDSVEEVVLASDNEELDKQLEKNIDLEVTEKEIDLERQKLEKGQVELEIIKNKMKMELELLKLK